MVQTQQLQEYSEVISPVASKSLYSYNIETKVRFRLIICL